MDGEANQGQTPSLLPTNSTAADESPKKTATGGGSDRLKRDEWSEGAVSSLLEAYEAKWVLRNRAKLKGQDWEDVARHVSARANHTKSPKTQTQCKNKIESMKKRYRSESATADGSSWPLYPRLDHLLRGSQPQPQMLQLQPQPQAVLPLNSSAPLLLLEQCPPMTQPPPPPPPPPPPAQISHGSNGVGRVFKEDDEIRPKLSEQIPEKAVEMETDSSTPAVYGDEEKAKAKRAAKAKAERRRVKRRREEREIAGSIRWLAEVVMRSERTRMETMKEIEKMRAEAEAKRGEMDLKRTEIVANTQLEIARLFATATASAAGGKGIDSSLRIGRN